MRPCAHARSVYDWCMAKLSRAEKKAANKARWSLVNAMRMAAYRACAGAPPPPGVTPEAWTTLAAGATASADDLRMSDAAAKALGLGPEQHWADAILPREAVTSNDPPRSACRDEPRS